MSDTNTITKAKPLVVPCPNCGWLAKRQDQHQTHINICALLPRPEEIVKMLNSGMTKEAVVNKYSTREIPISKTFIHRLVKRIGYSAIKGHNPEVARKRIIEVYSWHNIATPCSRCGILSHKDINEVPHFVPGKSHWFTLHPSPEVGLNWQDKDAQTGSPICQMCHSELGGK